MNLEFYRKQAIEEVQYGIQMETGTAVSEEQALRLIKDESSPFHRCLVEDMGMPEGEAKRLIQRM